MQNGKKWLKKHVDESLEKVADNILEVRSSLQEMSIQTAEQRDKKGRRNNLIIYKIPELMSQGLRTETKRMSATAYNCLTTVFMYAKIQRKTLCMFSG